MIMHRNAMPNTNDITFPNLPVSFNPIVIPKICENSVRPLIDAETKFPLRKRMARKAIIEVVDPDEKP